MVPGAFEIAHGLDYAIDFRIPDKGEDGGIYAGGVGGVGGVVAIGGAEELARRFVGFY